MAQEYVGVAATDGRVVPFAVEIGDDSDYDGPIPAARVRDGIKISAARTLDSGVELVMTIAEAITRKVGSLPNPPDRVSAEVGLAVTSAADFVVASSSAQAHIVVKMDWETVPRPPEPNAPGPA